MWREGDVASTQLFGVAAGVPNAVLFSVREAAKTTDTAGPKSAECALSDDDAQVFDEGK